MEERKQYLHKLMPDTWILTWIFLFFYAVMIINDLLIALNNPLLLRERQKHNRHHAFVLLHYMFNETQEY